MKTVSQLIAVATFALGAVAFADPNNQVRSHTQANEHMQTGAADRSSHTPGFKIAEDGSDRTPGFKVAEDGSDRTVSRQA